MWHGDEKCSKPGDRKGQCEISGNRMAVEEKGVVCRKGRLSRHGVSGMVCEMERLEKGKISVCDVFCEERIPKW
jgi:hypothetical protein